MPGGNMAVQAKAPSVSTISGVAERSTLTPDAEIELAFDVISRYANVVVSIFAVAEA